MYHNPARNIKIFTEKVEHYNFRLEKQAGNKLHKSETGRTIIKDFVENVYEAPNKKYISK